MDWGLERLRSALMFEDRRTIGGDGGVKSGRLQIMIR